MFSIEIRCFVDVICTLTNGRRTDVTSSLCFHFCIMYKEIQHFAETSEGLSK